MDQFERPASGENAYVAERSEVEQITITADDEFGASGECACEDMIIVWIAADGLGQRLRLDEIGKLLVVGDQFCDGKGRLCEYAA